MKFFCLLDEDLGLLLWFLLAIELGGRFKSKLYACLVLLNRDLIRSCVEWFSAILFDAESAM